MKKISLLFILPVFLVSFSCLSNQTIKTARFTGKNGENYPVQEGKNVTFSVHAPDAVLVTIAGQFNGWNPQATEMKKLESGIWTVTLELKPGPHRYKYLIDGIWIPDPDNPLAEPDGFGGLNSIFRVARSKK